MNTPSLASLGGGGAGLRAGRYTVHVLIEKSQHPLFRAQPVGKVRPAPPRRPFGYAAPEMFAAEADQRTELLEEEMRERFGCCMSLAKSVAADSSTSEMEDAAVTALSQNCRINTLLGWAWHVELIESIRRRFIEENDEAEGWQDLCCRFAHVTTLSVQGIDPLKRFLRKFIVRQRACNILRDRKTLGAMSDEARSRNEIAAASLDALRTVGMEMFWATEAVARTGLIRTAFFFFYGSAVAQLNIQKQIDLFEIKFACPLANAPKVCGRVARNSLFHELALRETCGRQVILRQQETTMRGADAWKLLNALVSTEEPSARDLLTRSAECEVADVVALRHRVMSYYCRRELEHFESELRTRILRQEEKVLDELEIPVFRAGTPPP
jgi:hypothetical protein